MSFRKRISHVFYGALHRRGWVLNKLEKQKFLNHDVLASTGVFSRAHEKDDAWLFALSRNCSNILDVGCNVGQSSLLLTIGTQNNIVCVDPNPDALSRCAQNLILNNLAERARFVNAFVSEKDKEKIRFYSSLFDAAGSMFSGFAKTSSSLGRSYLVETRTVDNIVDSLCFFPNLIKVDVEGAEAFVLRGSTPSKCNYPLYFVEVHSGPELSIEKNTTEILNWCISVGYDAYYLKEKQIITDTNRIKHRGRYHLLLVKQGAPFPECLNGIEENDSVQIFNN